ncbi:MAG: efflux RND transporter permease subunit [Pseudomonadota bacterium]
MNITRFAIEQNRTTLVLLFVIIFAGVQAYLNMPRAYDPGFIIRAAQVITYFPGASPERVEELVSDKIEKVIQEIPELDFVTSESRTGVSIVVANIKESYKNMRPIWDSLRRKIDAIDDLPDDVIGPIVNDEFGDVFGIVLGLTGEGVSYAELKSFADQARDEFLRIPDAAKVEIYGAQEERVFVEYNNARMAELNLSPTQLSQILSARNIVVPGGSITVANERIELEPTGNFQSVEDIGQTIIQLPGSSQVFYLDDIATVTRGYVDPSSTKVRVTGLPALSLAISMREGGNNIELGTQVIEVMTRLQNAFPYGLELEVVNFSPAEVETKVNDFVTNLGQAIGVVALVIIISLGIRTGLVVAALIPASMVFAILIMSLFEIGLDQISLAALIIALGMLVDNGIVMSENTLVRMKNGQDAIDAAVDSANELRIPLLTSSMTTAAAFLPIFLAESAVGEFTASLFKVVAITLLCSWILSLTVIPLLCVKFLKSDNKPVSFDNAFYRAYRAVLSTLIRFRYVTLAAVLAIFFGAMNLFQYIPNIFFPPSDRTFFTMEVELPLGTSIERTESVVTEIESFVDAELKVHSADDEGIVSWISYIGSGGPRYILGHNAKSSSSNYSLFIINATSAQIIDDLIAQLNTFSFDSFPDADIKVKKIETGTAVANPVEIRLYGRDTDTLFALATDIKNRMSEMPALKNISDNWGQRIKKLVVQVDQTRALRAGVSSQDIAVSLQTGLSGLEMTQYREGEDNIPITLRSSSADRENINTIRGLAVYSQSSGVSVPLQQVANVEVEWQASKVLRRDRLKAVTVSAQLQPGGSAALSFEELVPWLEEESQSWPLGFDYELGGEAESSGEANQSIADKLPIALAIILLLLVAQFNSIRKPIIILSTVPLGLIGVVFGLLAGQSYFGFITFLGVISLAGIVINNAIVLLERIKIEIEDNGFSPVEGIVEASQRRLRPIVLTTATTVLGLLPLYFGGGEFWEPMALSIMGGLLFSTILTLLAVPVMYATLYRAK